MKKILILALLASNSAFAALPDTSYYINGSIYILDNGNKKLVSSSNLLLNNDGEKADSFISREVGDKSVGLKEGLTFSGKITKASNNDVFDFSGVETRIENLKTSEDYKWQEGNITSLSFKNSMLLKDNKTEYTAKFNGKNEKYLLEVKVNKVDFIPKGKSEVKKEDYVYINSVVKKNSNCSPNGLTAKDEKGSLVKCSDGVWN